MKQFRALCLLMALLIAVGAIPAAAENNEAPRTYFPYPSELEQLADNFSLPDPFQFFNASADPNGSGTVDSPEEWPARAAELKDMLQYYLYGNRIRCSRWRYDCRRMVCGNGNHFRKLILCLRPVGGWWEAATLLFVFNAF